MIRLRIRANSVKTKEIISDHFLCVILLFSTCVKCSGTPDCWKLVATD